MLRESFEFGLSGDPLGAVVDRVGFEIVLRSSGTPSTPARQMRRSLEFDLKQDRRWTVDLDFPIAGKIGFAFIGPSDSKAFTIQIRNGSDEWVIEEVVGPVLRIRGAESCELLLPDGLGKRVPVSMTANRHELLYPSGRCTMAWSALVGRSGGIYLGRHDPDFSSLRIFAKGKGESLSWGIAQRPWVAPGKMWQSAPIILQRYEGSWEAAAGIYRSWAATWSDRRDLPAWPSGQSGWMLAILKQQNQEILWSYRDLGRVWKLALDRGLTAVGLFGWAHGGHDRYYPNYYPDPAMGGEEELRRALAEARELGLRTILYANGQLIDTATEFYRWHGNDACSWKPDHEPYLTSIRKFNSCTPVAFALGCHGAPRWQEEMRRLAYQAESLGADGILYDQVGVAPPVDCHHPGHGHDHPGSGWTTERVAFYRDLSAEMRRKNREFIIMTEGVFDALTPHMGWFHGWGTGFASRPIYEFLGDGKNDFPSLFRHVFPDVPLTQRFSTPVLGADEAQHAFFHGLSHEIEARWRADVAYLEEGLTPTQSDYADCTYFPPDVELMQKVSPRADCQQLRRSCDFTAQHVELLRRGRIVSGMEISGGGACKISGRIGEGQAAVIAWNTTSEPQDVRPLFRNLEPCAIEDLNECHDTDQPIPPGAIRVFFYQIS